MKETAKVFLSLWFARRSAQYASLCSCHRYGEHLICWGVCVCGGGGVMVLLSNNVVALEQCSSHMEWGQDGNHMGCVESLTAEKC